VEAQLLRRGDDLVRPVDLLVVEVLDVGRLEVRRVELANLRLLAARIPVEVEGAVGGDQVVEPLHALVDVDAGLALVHAEERFETQRHLGEDPKRAEGDLCSAEQFGVAILRDLDDLSRPGDHPRGHHLRREVAEGLPPAVGPRADRAGDRLLVDIPQVLHREVVVDERLADLAQDGTRTDGGSQRVTVRPAHASELVDGDERVVGFEEWRGGVARPDRSQHSLLVGGAAHEAGQFVLGPRREHTAGLEADAA
jgi:hypothetical protein